MKRSLSLKQKGRNYGELKIVVSGDSEPEAYAGVGREIRAAKKQGFAEVKSQLCPYEACCIPATSCTTRRSGGVLVSMMRSVSAWARVRRMILCRCG
jgi:hypothetical protein